MNKSFLALWMLHVAKFKSFVLFIEYSLEFIDPYQISQFIPEKNPAMSSYYYYYSHFIPSRLKNEV